MDYEDSFIENRNFVFSLVFVFLITYGLTLTCLWQLIIIPALLAGIMNEKAKKGIISGILGVLLAWIIYMAIAFMTRNAYPFFDQFAAEIFGSLGFGWLILAIVFFLGILIATLGAIIGNGIAIILKERKTNREPEK